MSGNLQDKEIARLKKRLANARHRAAYASGRPSFRGFGAVGKSGHIDELYELAMCDIESLCTILEAKTGKKFKRSDPKRDFNHAFTKALLQRHAPAPGTASGPGHSTGEKES